MIASLRKLLPPSFYGFGLMTLAKVIGGLIVVKLAVMHLGADGFGHLGQLLALVAIVSMLAGGGITNALIQGLAANDDPGSRSRLWGAALKIYALQGVSVALLLIVFRSTLSHGLLGREDLAWIMVVLAATQLLTGASNLVQAVLSATRQVRGIVLINIVGSALGAGLFVAALQQDGFAGAALGAVLYPAATGIVGLASAALLLPRAWWRPDWRSVPADQRQLLSYALVTLVSVTAMPLAQMLVRDGLGSTVGWEHVGHWQSVLKISDVYMQFFGLVLIYYALPRFSAQPTQDALDREFRQLQWPLMGVMIAGLGAIYLLRDIVIHVLFTADFMPARDYFLPQMIGDLLRMLALLRVYYTIARGARLVPIANELFQAVLLVLFSDLLLPRLGAITPVYAYGLGSFVSLVLIGLLRRHYQTRRAAPTPSGEQRILMVCSKYADDDANGWLTNELATSLVARGASVDVLHLDWAGTITEPHRRLQGGVNVVSLPVLRLSDFMPSSVTLMAKWGMSSHHAARQAKMLLPEAHYDAIIGFSPAIVTDGLVKAYAQPNQTRYLVYWDFFPVHQVELGLLPRAATPIARRLEQRAVNRYSHAGCMSPANIAFFCAYFPGFAGRVEHLPVWGPDTVIDCSQREATREEYGFDTGDVVCVFGGQLVPGRDIERLCDLAAQVENTLPNVKFVVAGSGPLAALVQGRAAASKNLRFLGQMPRAQYEGLLAAADIGLVFTASQVSVPTFPSKTVDYFRAALPVLGAMEQGGDYSAILEQEIGAGFSGYAGDRDLLTRNLTKLAESPALREACGQRGLAYYQSHMTAPRIAARLLARFGHARPAPANTGEALIPMVASPLP